ncbi:MAG: phosphate acyltransferase, partial [Rhodobacteraceae bacterium]|nr:phosphate acyltransferase [Paracoccaceae bacterium]
DGTGVAAAIKLAARLAAADFADQLTKQIAEAETAADRIVHGEGKHA